MRRLALLHMAVFIHMAVVSLSATDRPREFRSVPILSVMHEGALKGVCSGFSIHEHRRLWLTAAHCFKVGELHIEQEKVVALIIDPTVDIALLQTMRVSAPALKLARSKPRFGDEVRLISYPLNVPMVTRGWVANPDAELMGSPPPSRRAVFQVMSWVGGSGGPILNLRGEVVSLMQTTQPDGFSPMTGGVIFEWLQRFARYFESEALEIVMPRPADPR